MSRAEQYVDQLEAHLDEGGKINDGNVRDLILFIRELTAKTRDLSVSLESASTIICDARCPTTWKTSEPRPHSPECVMVKRVISQRGMP